MRCLKPHMCKSGSEMEIYKLALEGLLVAYLESCQSHLRQAALTPWAHHDSLDSINSLSVFRPGGVSPPPRER